MRAHYTRKTVKRWHIIEAFDEAKKIRQDLQDFAGLETEFQLLLQVLYNPVNPVKKN